MTKAEKILHEMLENYTPTWRYEMGYPTGYECSFCQAVISGNSKFNDPDEHGEDCPLAAALRWAATEQKGTDR